MTQQKSIEGLMQLVAEYGQARWSEGGSAATYLDRATERHRREEAADLSKEIRAYAADLLEAPAPQFRVHVAPMQASNGLTYVVCLDRADNPDGGITPINRNDVDEANSEGVEWAEFLGVPFTPCEPVTDTAAANTVPEYGASVLPDVPVIPQEPRSLKMIEEIIDHAHKMTNTQIRDALRILSGVISTDSRAAPIVQPEPGNQQGDLTIPGPSELNKTALPEALSRAAKTAPELILYSGSTRRPYIDINGGDLWMDAGDVGEKDLPAIKFMVDAANFVRRMAFASAGAAEALKPELNPESAPADALDAKRYRWLRDERSVGIDTMLHGNGCKAHSADELDAAVDAAMKEPHHE